MVGKYGFTGFAVEDPSLGLNAAYSICAACGAVLPAPKDDRDLRALKAFAEKEFHTDHPPPVHVAIYRSSIRG